MNSLLRSLGLAVLLSGTGRAPAAEKEPPPKKADLVELAHHLPNIGGTYKLAPEWVGTVRRVDLREETGRAEKDKPNNLRLTHAVVRPFRQNDFPPMLTVMRMGNGSYSGGDSAVYRAELPTAAEISELSLSEMTATFGRSRGFSDLWGGESMGLHSNAGWSWFTFDSPTKLRFMHISVLTVKWSGAKEWEIESLNIEEGLLRPANPKDRHERAKFNTGEGLAKAGQQDQPLASEIRPEPARAVNTFPLPLRKLVEAQKRSSPRQLAAYKNALTAARAHPDPALISQMVAALTDDGTGQIQMLMDCYFGTSFATFRLAAWDAQQKIAAQRQLVNALDAATTPIVFEQALTMLLGSFGGGSLELDMEGGAHVELAVSEGGFRSESKLSPETLRAAIAATQKYLWQEHPELREPQHGQAESSDSNVDTTGVEER